MVVRANTVNTQIKQKINEIANNSKLREQVMSHFYTILCLGIIHTSIFAMDKEPKPNPVFETVNPPNTSISDIPKTSPTK